MRMLLVYVLIACVISTSALGQVKVASPASQQPANREAARESQDAAGLVGAEVLTNADVIEMAQAGLSTKVISYKISHSRTNFRVSTKDLIKLKESDVPHEVVLVMLQMAAVSTANPCR